MLKQKITITFSRETPKYMYPKDTSPELAAHIDKLNLSGNTESLLEMLAETPYSVEVIPVDSGVTV